MGIFTYLSVALLAVAGQVQAQVKTSSAYTDSSTGIDFQGVTQTTGFRLGLVLPQQPGADFVGQIQAPLRNNVGWGGLALGPGMAGHLLITTWPNGTNVASSFREASAYAAPPVWNGTATMTPIKNGTFVNATHVSFTFLCSGCLKGEPLTFDPKEAEASLGHALAYSTPVYPKDPNTRMTLHDAGTNIWTINLNASKSTKYATFAAMAGK